MDRDFVVRNDIAHKYLRNRLTPEEQIEFEEFLLDAPELVAQLDEEAVFLSASSGAFEDADRVTKTEHAESAVRPQQYFAMAAAVLAAVSLGLVVNLIQTKRHFEETLARYSRPSTATPVVLGRSRAGEPVDATEVRIAEDQAMVLLVIPLRADKQQSYGVAISRHGQETTRLELTGVEPTHSGDLYINLPADALAAGDHEVVITGEMDPLIQTPRTYAIFVHRAGDKTGE